MVKSKGGLRYSVMTADKALHEGVAPKDIHFTAAPLAPGKGVKSAPAERLKDFEEVLNQATPLLVDIEVLEIAWEMALEEDETFQIKALSKLLNDESASPVDLYRTFRVLSSELGRVFFKAAKGEGAKWNARTKKTVEAAKQSLCANTEEDYSDFCLV